MEGRKWTPDGFTIRDKTHYSEGMSALCMSDTYSDLVLISKEGSRLPSHRAILAARSDYFSALLYGGLKETGEKEVNVLCSAQVLKTVLTFLYSGEVILSPELPFLTNLLLETRKMFLTNLQDAVEDLVLNDINNNIQDAIELFSFGIDFDFENLAKASKKYLEDNVDEILNSVNYMENFSASSLKDFLSGDDLDVPEIEIFRGVSEWIKTVDATPEEKKAVLSAVKLDQMTNKQLKREVQPSGLFSDTEILNTVRLEERHGSSRKVIINENICLESMGAEVIKAEPRPPGICVCPPTNCSCLITIDLDVLIAGKVNGKDYNENNEYVMSKLGERMEIKLPSKQKINKINILFHDREALDHDEFFEIIDKNYSYKIESSMDGIKWEIVADFSKGSYWGKSMQTVYFEERRTKFIGIVGTAVYRKRSWMDTSDSNGTLRKVNVREETPRGYLHVIAVEAMLDTDTEGGDRKNVGMVKM